ncbi:MAG: four helix bundle protein [Candidatus Shapirobacteria bacterium]|jgi:four helix bundle protein
MKIERFEDSLVWKKSRDLTLGIYKNLKDCRDFSFRDQICRASVSIMNNIAEGFEKGTDKDLAKFLFIAKGSSGETRSMLYLARDLKYLDDNRFKLLYQSSIEISKMLWGFIKSLKIKETSL